MFEWIVSSSVLITVVILLRFALRGKISLRLQYALWALVLVRLLVPFSIGVSSFSVMGQIEQTSIYQETTQTITEIQVPSDIIRDSELTYNEAVQAGNGTLHRVEGYPQDSGKGNLHTYSYQDSLQVVGAKMLRVIWLCGFAVVSIWFLFSNLSLYRSLKKNRTMLDSDFALPVYLSSTIDTPCLFGVFSPAVYLTDEAIESERTQRHAVEHELTHYRHRDNIWSILRCVCLAVHWYNPLVWWAAMLSRNDAELACDEATILRLGEEERVAYGRTLIRLTCEKHTALLNTATTMTGSGKSIRERIALIAKKPQMAVYTLIAVILVAVVAVGCTFTGAEKSDTPWNWAQTLTIEDITSSAILWNDDGGNTTLSDEESAAFVKILNALKKGDFTENTKLTGGTPTYGLTIQTANGEYHINESIAPYGSLEMSYGDSLWWIDNNELAAFVKALLSNVDPQDMIAAEVDERVPQAVISYARDYVQQQIDYHNELGNNPPEGSGNYAITSAKIVGLEQINTGTAGLNDGVALYLLEYRLLPDHPENIVMAGGMSVESGWLTEHGSTGQPYLLLYYADSGSETVWTPICVTNTDVIKVDYGTPEMLEKYGNAYTAAALELYQKRLQGFDTITRLTTLRPEDIKHTAGFCDVDAAEITSLLSVIADNRIDRTEGVRNFWTLEVYLSGGPNNFNTGTDEWFSIRTGPEENIVEIIYHSEEDEYTTLYFENNALYWFVRGTYTTEEIIDETAMTKFGEILSSRAQARVEDSNLNETITAYNGYEIVYFVKVDEFTQDGEKYEIYEWDVAFFHDNPIATLAGGMWVDSELRVRSLDHEIYFVTRTSGDLVDYQFFFWDLYSGPDEETGKINAHTSIIEVFSSALDMRAYCASLTREWQLRFDRNKAPMSFLRVDNNRERELTVEGNMLSVLSSAANSLQKLDDPDGFRSLGGGIYVWFDSTRHLSFFAGEEPFYVKIRYVAEDANESAIVNDPQLYLYLVASAERENVQLHDLDHDGFLEAILWQHSENNLIIYDFYEEEIHRIDTNKTIGCSASDYTGLIANINPAYNNMIQGQDADGAVSVYRYEDGEFSYQCPINEVIG